MGMFHSGIWVAAGSLLLATLVQDASAGEGSSGSLVRASHGFTAPARIHGGWRGGRAGRGVGVYLDRDRGAVVNVSVSQSFVAPQLAPSPFFVPSLTDLPAVAGIRNAPAAQAAVYVLNEDGRSRPGLRRSSGPRIIQALPDGRWERQPDEPFGAKVIHLSVPVGSSD